MDKARAKKAYDSINDMIGQKDLNSDNLFEDLISEKAFALDRVSNCPYFDQHVFFSSPICNKKVHKTN